MLKSFTSIVAILCLFTFQQDVRSEDEKPTFEEKVADSRPLSSSSKLVKAGAALRVTHLYMDKPYLAGFFTDGPISLSINDGKMTVLFKKRVHRLVLPNEEGGKLNHDTTFGEGGVMPYEEDKGWQPVEKMKFGKKFVSRPLGDLIGIKSTEDYHHLVLTDQDGAEVAKLGTKDGLGEICSLMNACRYKQFIFIIDANCRDLDVWTVNGKFLFEISMRELGLDYPWPMSIDITDEGELYLGYTHERARISGGKRNSGVTESAFVLITGLDQIDIEQAETQ